MEYLAVEGANKKWFVQMSKMNGKEDFDALEVVRSIVSRREYKQWSKGFNKWVSETFLVNETFFPIQFWPDVEKQLIALGYHHELLRKDKVRYNLSREDFDNYIYSLPLPEKYDIVSGEYMYQPDSVYEAITNKLSRIEIGTSGGKTLITYLLCRFLIDHKICNQSNKIMIVVPTQQLCKQAQRDFKEYDEFNDNKINVETIYSGAMKYLGSDVVIGTYHSLREYDAEYFNDFNTLIIDEAHQGKAYSIRTEIYNKCSRVEFCFGTTGTWPEYKTLDYLNVVSMFGPLTVVKKAYQLIEDGNSTPVKIYALKLKYSNFEDNQLSQNFKENGIIGAEKYRLEKAWFQNNVNRTKVLGNLCNKMPGNSLILVDTVAYVEYLAEFLTEHCPDKIIAVIHGGIKDRSEICASMETADGMIIIATYGTMSTGVSIKNLSNIYFPDGGKSPIRIKQSIGRGMRLFPSKEYCLIFDFQDTIPFCSFKGHAAYRNKIYRDEKFPITEIEITIN